MVSNVDFMMIWVEIVLDEKIFDVGGVFFSCMYVNVCMLRMKTFLGGL